MQSYLATAYRLTSLPQLWAECLTPLMEHDRINEIVDLGSGAGGPMPLVANELRRFGFTVRVTLTDRFPNAAAAPLHYWPDPVDARQIPEVLSGIRTMFAAFHHFDSADAHQILRNAFERRRPICVFEATSQRAAVTAILIPLVVLALTPKIRPLSWMQIFFTYLIPILPLLIFWDGLVSHLRTYSVAELRELTRDLYSPDYSWDIGMLHTPGSPIGLPYLIGRPAS
jgi:hypothetical protein